MIVAEKKEIDWGAMENDWRAGIVPVLTLSKQFNVSRAAIIKHWDKAGIERDLTAKIKAKAEALVTQAAVTATVTQEQRATEKTIIAVNAQMQADIMLAHRTDIQRNRKLAMTLLAEMEAQTGEFKLYEQLGEMLASPDEKGVDKLNELYRRVISTPSRIDSAKKLAETLKVLIGLERQALKLDDAPQDPAEAAGEVVRSVAAGVDSALSILKEKVAKAAATAE